MPWAAIPISQTSSQGEPQPISRAPQAGAVVLALAFSASGGAEGAGQRPALKAETDTQLVVTVELRPLSPITSVT